MNHSGDTNDAAAVDEALRSVLGGMPEFASPICETCRQPSEYRSSFTLEEITVRFSNGQSLVVLFKNLAWQSLTPDAERAKPALLYDPVREIEVYRRLLAERPLGTARFYGAVVDPAKERYWLFLEKVAGAELYQYGPLDVWGDAARWLARLHQDDEVLRAADNAAVHPHLVRYDFSYFRVWIDRAVEYVGGRQGPESAARLRELAVRYDDVAQFLASLPATFIHGEFYASNVLLDTAVHSARVCAVDWELAGIGPDVIDLAALVGGKWTDEQRAELIGSYRSGLAAGHCWSNDLAGLLRALDYARLHLAVQWLGWSPEWTPPAAHAQNWLAEALQLGKKLGLIEDTQNR